MKSDPENLKAFCRYYRKEANSSNGHSYAQIIYRDLSQRGYTNEDIDTNIVWWIRDYLRKGNMVVSELDANEMANNYRSSFQKVREPRY